MNDAVRPTRSTLGHPRPPRTPARSALSTALLWILIVYLAIPLNVLTAATEQQANSGSEEPISQVLKLALLAISALLLVQRRQALGRLLRRVNVFFLVFLILVPVSYAWSISPPNTASRFATILSVVGVCLVFCTDQWSPQRFQSVLRSIITLILIGSVIFVLVDPTLGLQPGDGKHQYIWRGLLPQKNPFGDMASFGVIFWLHAKLSSEVAGWKALLGGGVSLLCLVMSHSANSLLATIFVVGFLLLLLRSTPGMRRYMPYVVSLFAIVVVTYALAVLRLIPGSDTLLHPITLITGKSMTFSNRSEIWAIVKQHVDQSPILGSGYGAYWIGPVPSSPSYVFLSRMYFYPTESHNGYLEMANNLGYVGLICLFAYLFVFIRQSLQLFRVDRALGALYLALFFQQGFINLAESCWLNIDSEYIFGIMTLATLAMARSLVEQQRRTTAAKTVPRTSLGQRPRWPPARTP